jgi:hypothetical protein
MVTFRTVRITRVGEQGWTIIRAGSIDFPTMHGFFTSHAEAEAEAEAARLSSAEPALPN